MTNSDPADRPPFCLWCEYPLEGIAGAVCPECGRVSEWEDFLRVAVRRSWWVVGAWAAGLCLAMFGLIVAIAVDPAFLFVQALLVAVVLVGLGIVVQSKAEVALWPRWRRVMLALMPLLFVGFGLFALPLVPLLAVPAVGLFALHMAMQRHQERTWRASEEAENERIRRDMRS